MSFAGATIAAMKGKRFAIAAGALTVAVLVGAGFAFRSRIREEWLLWKLEHGDEAVVQTVADKLAEVGSARTIPRLFHLILQDRNRIPAGKDPDVRTFTIVYEMTGAPIGGRREYGGTILEIFKTSMGGENALLDSGTVEVFKGWYLVTGRKEMHAMFRRVLAIAGCIARLVAEAGRNALPSLSRVEADPSLSHIVRHLASIEMENARQAEKLGEATAEERQVIEELRMPGSPNQDAAVAKAAAGSERMLPVLLDVYMEDGEVIIGSPSPREALAGFKAIRAIIERRKEAAVPVLVDLCMSVMDEDICRDSARFLRESDALARRALPLLEKALRDGTEQERRRAAIALREIQESE